MKVYGIIITYNPELHTLLNLCQQLKKSSVNLILVDNSENKLSAINSNLLEGKVIVLGGNLGIAQAQNVGIFHALEEKADVIIFFDQDSEIEKNFIPNLLKSVVVGKPMVVAPIFYDLKNKFEYPSFVLNNMGILKPVLGDGEKIPYLVDAIISSGSAATAPVFQIAGMMDEDFFIDFVDIEWSLRCRRKNIPIYIVPDAKMKHSIGETNFKFGKIRLFIHSSVRSYYKLRNPFLLLRKKSIPVNLAIKEILAALTHQFFQLFFVKGKIKYAKIYLKAIVDGIAGKKGKIKLKKL